MEDQTSLPVAKTYIWHKEECFFVSTIERESSAMLGPGRYNETMVWESDWYKGKLLGLLHQDEGGKGSIEGHLYVVKRIFKEGRYWDKVEDTDECDSTR